MALLYRFTKLNDRFNTGIFTFIVTRSVTRDLHRDATTKDFYYGYHRWAISFTRANDRALGVFLLLRNPSPSTKCYADFTLTLLNREHSGGETTTNQQTTIGHKIHVPIPVHVDRILLRGQQQQYEKRSVLKRSTF